MKIVKNTLLLLSVAALIFLFNSCRCVQGEGPVTTQSRDLSDFSEVEMSLSGNVTLIQGSSFKVDVSAQENLHELITTEISRNKLEISHKGNCISSDGGIDFEITMPKLEGVFINGSGNISSQGSFKVDKIETEIEGSGKIMLDLIAEEVDTEINGSGDIEIKGTTQKQRIEIEGSGDYRAADLLSYDVKVDVEGSGNAYLLVHDKLDVKISGSGNVYYSGNPKIDTKINGSGTVSKR